MFFGGVGVEINPLLLLGMGAAVGVCSGFFGFGGGFMMTPALHIFGFPMPYAIGTDLMQMAGSAVLATMRHRKLGHVDLRLGWLMVVGTVAGVEVGKQLVMYMEGVGNVDLVVRWIYIVLLSGMGLYMLREARRAAARDFEGTGSRGMLQSGLASKIKSLNIPPFVSLPVSGILRVSVWVPMGIGFITGILAGLLGVGGGFIRMPALIYLLGVPTVVAVGTDLFEIIISGSYGAFTYALSDRVELMAAVLILVGASAGVQIGTIATRYVREHQIRRYFAVTILLAGVSVLLKQVGSIAGLSYMSTAAGYLLLGVAGGISLLIVILFLKARSAAQSIQTKITNNEQSEERR